VTLQKRVYFRDELAIASVTVQNRSHITQNLLYGCGYGALGVEVLNAGHRVLYPPVLLDEPPSHGCGAVPSYTRTAPGQVRHRLIYVIVRGRYIRALVFVATGRRTNVIVVSRPVLVRLISGQRPGVIIHATPHTVYADLRPSATVHGPLLYRYWVECRITGSISVESSEVGYQWTPAKADQIRPDWSGQGCVAGAYREWHGLAGWLGQPVAAINYDGH
jgi:hypothetical protein